MSLFLCLLCFLVCLATVTKAHQNAAIFNHFPGRPSSNTSTGLSDEELSFQFTLAWETFLNPGVWLEEWGLQNNPSQGSFASLRYQLGFAAYASASICTQTPAYQQVCNAILSDTIVRMIDNVVWGTLVDHLWGPRSYSRGMCSTPNNPNSVWAAASSWPDPVAFQNIMYSGHLAQMLVLFEAVTGNDTYSVHGWDFVYNDTLSFHYTTGTLLDILAEQQLEENNKQGGIPCEPFNVFMECNEHQNVALNMYNVAIQANEDYASAAQKFSHFLTTECRRNDDHTPFEGWVYGIYLQDKETYFINGSNDDGEWSEEHWNCGYNNGNSGFSGIPNSPPRDIWIAAMAFLWLSESEIESFVCNDGLIKLFDDRLWKYSEEYDGWVLSNHVDMGIAFGTAMYTIGAKQCLWFNEQAGFNVTAITERIDGSVNYLINRFGENVDNRYNLSAPLLNTWHVDNGFGAPILDTANMLASMTLTNDSFREVFRTKWPALQTSMQLLEVDYPRVMVPSANVLAPGVLQFEVIVAIVPPTMTVMSTQLRVKLDGENENARTIEVTMNGNAVPASQLTVKGNQLLIDAEINVKQASVFQVITSNYKPTKA